MLWQAKCAQHHDCSQEAVHLFGKAACSQSKAGGDAAHSNGRAQWQAQPCAEQPQG